MSGHNRRGNRSVDHKSRHTDVSSRTEWKGRPKIEESFDGASSQNCKSPVTGESVVKDEGIDVNHNKPILHSLDEDGNPKKVKQFGDKPQKDDDNDCKSPVTGEFVVKDEALDVNNLKQIVHSLDEDSNSKKVKQFGDKPQKNEDNGELNNGNHHATRFDICPKRVNSAIKLNAPLHLLNKQKRKENKQSGNGQNIMMLGSGMVLMKHYLSSDDQISIVKTCREYGISDGGFYQPGYSAGTKLHLQMMCLGRNWDPETRTYTELRPFDNTRPPGIPEQFREMVKKAIRDSNEFVRGKGEALPSMSPDICIVNFYTQNGRLGLHQDKDESDVSLRKGLPVVSFSIGDTAEFLYGETRSVDEAKTVELESGDVLIFGGKSRMIYHGVPTIRPNTTPTLLQKATDIRAGRLNLTFRMY